MVFLAESLVRLTTGEDDECAEAVTRSRASVGGLEDRFTTTGLALVQARLELDSGNATAAGATLRRLRRRAEGWPMSEYLERWRELVELEVALAAGDETRLDDLVHSLSTGWDDVTHPKPQRLVLLGRAHLQAGRPDECLQVLKPLTTGTTTSLIAAVGAWVLTALAHDRMRRDAESSAAIARAVALADAEWIVRPFVTAGGRTRALLERHRHLALEHHAFVEHLVARLGGDSEHRTGTELVEPLTNRERSVLQLLPSMMSNAEIADELFVSVNTVKVHLKALYRKLGVGSRRQAVARARALGLLAAGSSRSA
jgi:LuxR family maltose regulon positive regulatory protein